MPNDSNSLRNEIIINLKKQIKILQNNLSKQLIEKSRELEICQYKVELLKSELKIAKGNKISDKTLAARINAQEKLGDALFFRTIKAPIHPVALTMLQKPRLRKQTSQKFSNIRDIVDVYPDYANYKGKSALPDALKQHLDYPYLITYMIRDRPDIFAGRVLTPHCIIIIDINQQKMGKITCATGSDRQIVDCDKIFQIIQSSKLPVLIPLVLYSNFLAFFKPNIRSNHANYLYIDVKHKQIEIFEPHGLVSWSSGVEKLVTKLFSKINFSVYSPGMSCPIGPQKHMGKLDLGFCVAHNNLYCVLRVLNPKASADRVYNYMSRGSPEDVRARIDQMAEYVADVLIRK